MSINQYATSLCTVITIAGLDVFTDVFARCTVGLRINNNATAAAVFIITAIPASTTAAWAGALTVFAKGAARITAAIAACGGSNPVSALHKAFTN
jgi:hypothetical protein